MSKEDFNYAPKEGYTETLVDNSIQGYFAVLAEMALVAERAKPPKPVEKPQIVPPIRKPEAEKKHIKRSGKR